MARDGALGSGDRDDDERARTTRQSRRTRLWERAARARVFLRLPWAAAASACAVGLWRAIGRGNGGSRGAGLGRGAGTHMSRTRGGPPESDDLSIGALCSGGCSHHCCQCFCCCRGRGRCVVYLTSGLIFVIVSLCLSLWCLRYAVYNPRARCTVVVIICIMF